MVAGTWSVAKSAHKRLFRKRRSRKGSTSTQSQQKVDRLVMSSSSTRGGGGSSVSSLALQENAEESRWLNKWTLLEGYRHDGLCFDSSVLAITNVVVQFAVRVGHGLCPVYPWVVGLKQ
ncbi:hypothetical protein OSTOST_16960, partial [Ostertagia ostertagi]